MQRIREYINQRRERKLDRLIVRSNELRVALAGISYLHHQDVWCAVAEDHRRTLQRIHALNRRINRVPA